MSGRGENKFRLLWPILFDDKELPVTLGHDSGDIWRAIQLTESVDI